ncbi:MAG TPA: hypothetical protein EYG03_28415, partial [Planctomycetes bacterium]|nr:hypothetical protein [Planctomycetota bacterium]
MLATVTVVVHGAAILPTSGPLKDMGNAIYSYFNSDNVDGSAGLLYHDPTSASLSLHKGINNADNRIVVFDWKDESNDFDPRWDEAASDALFALLVDKQLASSDYLHLIGHSRGAIVVSEATQRLLNHGFGVDHVTLLDHEKCDGTDMASAGDPYAWKGVGFVDNYYGTGTSEPVCDGPLKGEPVNGAYNVNLATQSNIVPDPDPDGNDKVSHKRVRTWYEESITNSNANNGFYWRRSQDQQPETQSGRTTLAMTPLLFNGNFTYSDVVSNELPGWERQGGGGTGHPDNNSNPYLALDFGSEDYTRTHNPLYFPQTVRDMKFDVWISNKSSNGDALQLYVGETSEGSPLVLDHTTNGFIIEQSIDVSAYAGDVKTITLRIDPVGGVDSEVRIDNVVLLSGPVADAGGPYSTQPDVSVTLDASASYDIDGSISSYQWDLDNDGEYDNGTGAQVPFSTASTGTFPVHVRVTDSDNFTSTNSTIIKTGEKKFSVVASSGAHGDVSPSGLVEVTQGADQTFTANPAADFFVDRWFVNSNAVQTGGTSYTLPNVQSSRQVFVTFKNTESGTLQVLAPNGGQVYGRGDDLEIVWRSTDVASNVRIELLSGNVLADEIASSTRNDGSFSWEIPDDQETGTAFRVRITSLDGSATDQSDGNFEIRESVTPPAVRQIGSFNQLVTLTEKIGTSEYPREGHYELTANIDASDSENDPKGFVPIGRNSNGFNGTFDGNGFHIQGLVIDRQEEDKIGLFSFLDDKAVIKNLTLDGGDIRGRGIVGAIAGENAGLIVNTHASAYVEGTADVVGGLVGDNHATGIIRNASTYISDYGETNQAEVRSKDDDEVGGLVGFNAGSIEWSWSTVRQVRAGKDVGGIAGVNWRTGKVRESYSRTDVYNGDAGGSPTGGVVGRNDGIVSDVYVLGSLHGNDDLGMGGVVGANDEGTINRAYYVGSGRSGRGGIASRNEGAIANSFWDTETTGVPADRPVVSGSGTITDTAGLTTSELWKQTTYEAVSWDFNDVWAIDEGVGYPVLQGVGPALPSPLNVTASTGRSDGVEVSWTSVSDVLYQIFRSHTADAAPDHRELLSDGWQSDATLIDASAAPDIQNHYWVKAAATASGARESNFSSSVAGSRVAPPITSPDGISASDDSGDDVLITWNAVPDATFYRVYRADALSGTKTPASGWLDGQRSFRDQNAFADKVYYYWVTGATSDSGSRESKFGDPDTGVRDASAPTVSVEVSLNNPTSQDELSVVVSAGDTNALDQVILYWFDDAEYVQSWKNIGEKALQRNHPIGKFTAGETVLVWAESRDITGNRATTSVHEIVILLDAPDSFSPADNATGKAVNTDLVIDFSENVQKGSG